MNTALILSGGVGSRMRSEMPKQYIKVSDKPIICYCLDIFDSMDLIDKIIIVCDEKWHSFLDNYVYNYKKFVGYASGGYSRQASIYNGLKKCAGFMRSKDLVIIHDAARPLVSKELIKACIENISDADGSLPCFNVKDTIYYSSSGKVVEDLLNRDCLFCGQSPEAFVFGKYLDIHEKSDNEEINITRGSSEIAFRHGLKIKLFDGDEINFKITTPADLKRFEAIIAEKEKH